MLKPAFSPRYLSQGKMPTLNYQTEQKPLSPENVFYLSVPEKWLWNAAEQIEKSVQSGFSIKQLLYCYGGHLSKP